MSGNPAQDADYVRPVPYYEDDLCTIYHGDCRELIPKLTRVDAVITDPPYPDWYVEEYRYEAGLLAETIGRLSCPQFVFWSAREPFPLSHTAIHIWNKNPSNHGAQYERIFERNGGNHYKVFTNYMVNSTVAAKMTHDVRVDHPSQKPIRLLRTLVTLVSGVILDPFMGSGTTLRAAKDCGRKAIGIEMQERYCEMAAKRLAQEVLMLDLPVTDPVLPADDVAVLTEAHAAIKELCMALIVVKGTLDKPYEDRPEWTPWTRWVEKPFQQGAKAEESVRHALKRHNDGGGDA